MITTRPITKDEIARFREQVYRGFGEDLGEEDRDSERFLALMPLDLTVGAYDGDEMVGTLAAFEFDAQRDHAGPLPTPRTATEG